jgi:sigma-B regulation protein RsbU (phosphoserine phosphatase)
MLKNPRLWLAVLLAWVAIFQGMIAYSAIDDLRNGESKPALPLQFGARLQIISGLSDEAREAGVRYGDVLETVDGKPFSNMGVLYNAVMRRKPGELLPVTVRSPKGTPFTVAVRIPAQASGPATKLDWTGQILLAIGLPAFCLSLGFWVAFIRPKDRLAWLLLALMIGFSGLPNDFPIGDWPGGLLGLVWWLVFASKFGLWAMWMLFFAILFPAPMRVDRKLPWLKWLLALPLMLNTAVLLGWVVGRQISFSAIEFLRRPLQLVLLFRTDLVLPSLVVLTFFIVIGLKSLTRESADGQRRLRILFLGSLLSLGPLLVQVARSVIGHSELLLSAGPLEYFATLLPLLLFPLTLAYVIVIRRAMDVQSTIRQGIQYALAQRGLTVLQIIVTAGVIGAIAVLSANRGINLAVRAETVAAGFLAILLVRRAAQWLAQWIDRRFFREAFNNEQILNELALSLRTLMEEKTLIQTLTQRISVALHVPRIAFLLNGGGELTPAYSTGYPLDPTLALAESGGIVRHLKVSQKATPIYFDDENNWIQTIHPEEQAPLKKYQTEVVLPVAVKDKLLGVMTLGPKQSAAPYTERDLQLLDAVATQAGFALENSRLTTQVAHEIAAREKLSREMEIAREVQERLFPQTFPPVQGVDYFGVCRPALTCGGDYYDFLTLPSGVFCIAIGDVSGKGIAAALLMASLQASLRGQAMQAGQDLAAQIGVVNRLIFDASTLNRYATFFYAQYHPPTRELEYVNAGHNPPIVLRKNAAGRSEVIRLETGGPVVGLLPAAAYLQDRVQLKENDLFIGFTDGISEAMNNAGEEWGEERMIEMLERCGGGDAAAIAKALISAADAFADGAPQHDDMTVLTMRILGQLAPGSSDARPEAERDYGQKAQPPALKGEIASGHDPGIGPHGLGHERKRAA